jgi:hypothetical protein
MINLETFDLDDFGTRVEYPRNFLLQKEGSVASKFWFLERGIARYIFHTDEKEFSGWFDLEGDFVGSIYSLLGFGPARETIQLIEDSVLIEIPIDSVKANQKVFEDFKLQVLEHYFLELELRVKFFQSMDGRQRYDYLMSTKPELIRRVPLKLLASFLGLTPESLSRIRASFS